MSGPITKTKYLNLDGTSIHSNAEKKVGLRLNGSSLELTETGVRVNALGITDGMLAGSISLSKLSDSAKILLTDANKTVEGGVITFATLPTLNADATSSGHPVRYSQFQAALNTILYNDKWKNPVLAIATTNVTLSGIQTIDGIASGSEGATTTTSNFYGIWTESANYYFDTNAGFMVSGGAVASYLSPDETMRIVIDDLASGWVMCTVSDNSAIALAASATVNATYTSNFVPDVPVAVVTIDGDNISVRSSTDGEWTEAAVAYLDETLAYTEGGTSPSWTLASGTALGTLRLIYVPSVTKWYVTYEDLGLGNVPLFESVTINEPDAPPEEAYTDVGDMISTCTVGSTTGTDGFKFALAGQTNPVENGFWISNNDGAWKRSDDFAEGYLASGTRFSVDQGATKHGTFWYCTTDSGADITGTDALTFREDDTGTDGLLPGAGLVQNEAAMDVNVGDGIQISADKVTIKLDGTTLAVGSSGLKINTSGVGATEINATALGDGLKKAIDGQTLTLKLTGSTLSVDGFGLKVASGGITATEINTSVAGAGLSHDGNSLYVGAGNGIAVGANAVALGYLTADWTVNNETSFRIKGLADPVDNQDAATKAWTKSLIKLPKFYPVTLTATHIANKYVTLPSQPLTTTDSLGGSVPAVQVVLSDGPGTFYGDHYVMDGVFPTRLSWDSKGLDGMLEEGEKFTVIYYEAP